VGKRITKKNGNSGSSKAVWVKSWHMIPCVHCANPTRAPKECPRILCGNCIANDPFRAFATWYGKKYKTFRVAKKYLDMTDRLDNQTDEDDQTLAKQERSRIRKTFALAAKKIKEEGKLRWTNK